MSYYKTHTETQTRSKQSVNEELRIKKTSMLTLQRGAKRKQGKRCEGPGATTQKRPKGGKPTKEGPGQNEATARDTEKAREGKVM